MKFNIEDFKKGKFAINCKTIDEAKELEKILIKYGISINFDNWFTKVWSVYGINTCYIHSHLLRYSSISFYKYNCKIPVYKFSDIDFTDESKLYLEEPDVVNPYEEWTKRYLNGDFKDLKPKPDMVNHPQHYQGKYECIDLMIAMFGIESVKGFCKCNSFKYRFRADRKNGAEDIKKAEWYEDKLMELNKQSVPTRKVIRYRKRRK